ncbi:MAG: 5-(carboxyamino)imidazole ribonucleotide mutase, partial [Bacteroidota bacterium]
TLSPTCRSASTRAIVRSPDHCMRCSSQLTSDDAQHRRTSTRSYAETAHERGIRVIIAGAGGAAHLPGMIAASTPLPVIGVPVPTRNLNGMDSLLSIVQMPGGVPVATVSIGNAKNAGLLAVQILSTADSDLRERMMAYKRELIALVETMDTTVAHLAEDAGQ